MSEEAELERMIGTLAPIGEAERRRALLIVNPHATAVTERLRGLVVNALAARYDVDAVETQRRGHAIELARDGARERYELIVAFGGDGTVNEAANGLAGTGVPLSCLPGGSANVFCKLLRIPGEIVDATQHLLALADRFEPHRVDLGVVEDRCFTFTAGVGLDARVVRAVDARPRLKARLGPYLFSAVAGVKFARHYLVRPPRMFVNAGGETFAGVTTVVQVAEHYTYFHDRPIDLATGARLGGGALAGVVLRRASALGAPALIVRALRGGVEGHRQVIAFAGVSGVTVSSATGRALPLQVDGDYLGEVSEARFGIRRGALSVVN